MNTFAISSPVGFWTVSTTETQIVAIDYQGETCAVHREAETRLELKVECMLSRYFKGERIDFSSLPIQFPEPVSPKSVNLRARVMQRLCEIPYGEVYSYQWMAEALGIPNGPRAVGNALGSNPIPIIVPCHRIIAKHGKLGGFMRGYEGGSRIKLSLLGLEGHRFEAQRLIVPQIDDIGAEQLPLCV